MQALEAEGLPMVEFPQSPSRMTPATTRMFEAVVNGTLTHSGDGRLARHVGNCVLRVDSRGSRLAKEHKHSQRRIDLAVASGDGLRPRGGVAGADSPIQGVVIALCLRSPPLDDVRFRY